MVSVCLNADAEVLVLDDDDELEDELLELLTEDKLLEDDVLEVAAVLWLELEETIAEVELETLLVDKVVGGVVLVVEVLDVAR